MRHRHDTLWEATGQAGTYRGLQVATGRAIFEMPGAEPDAVRALTRARVLRVADCEVRPDQVEHSDLGDRRHLVTTGWRDAASHERYAAEAVPALRERAGAADDLVTIRGHRVCLAAGWVVRAR